MRASAAWIFWIRSRRLPTRERSCSRSKVKEPASACSSPKPRPSRAEIRFPARVAGACVEDRAVEDRAGEVRVLCVFLLAIGSPPVPSVPAGGGPTDRDGQGSRPAAPPSRHGGTGFECLRIVPAVRVSLEWRHARFMAETGLLRRARL